ncbi:hypothetical protein OAA09_01695 [bacterium]|nr:hypothetical protein [bacterium]
MNWKSLDKNRKFRKVDDGIILIKPKQKISFIPASCPVCDVLFSSNLDLESYRNSNCCSYCETKYAFINREAWLEGVRPTKKEVDQDFKNRKLFVLNDKF